MKKTFKVVMLPIQEEWKDIKEYEGRYQISNYGKVKSLAREVPRTYRPYSVEERLLVITIDNNGRQVVGLTTNGKTMNKYVHRLVAQAFIPNPLNKPEVNHLDFDKLNNNIQNLEWVTEKENIQHSYDMRNKFMGLRNNSHLYIVSDDEIKEGDWFTTSIDSSKYHHNTPIHQCTSRPKDKDEVFNWVSAGEFTFKPENCKKIVATTDNSLEEEPVLGYQRPLPQIPESFIQAYIKAYNEAKPITEIDLEIVIGQGMEDGEIQSIKEHIKTRPDNTVIIHQSKLYSRDEVWKLLIKYSFDMGLNPIGGPKYDKWIQDNL